jgi:hypothetical protein
MTTCPTDALGRSECAEFLRSTMAETQFDGETGLEIHVSTQPPLTRGPYTTDGFRCPHGTTYWIEPTGEQIADWAERRVR